jgi:hypothetical protein
MRRRFALGRRHGVRRVSNKVFGASARFQFMESSRHGNLRSYDAEHLSLTVQSTDFFAGNARWAYLGGDIPNLCRQVAEHL